MSTKAMRCHASGTVLDSLGISGEWTTKLSAETEGDASDLSSWRQVYQSASAFCFDCAHRSQLCPHLASGVPNCSISKSGDGGKHYESINKLQPKGCCNCLQIPSDAVFPSQFSPLGHFISSAHRTHRLSPLQWRQTILFHESCGRTQT
jgi:hypothetical protein